jgi:hypothetical protein
MWNIPYNASKLSVTVIRNMTTMNKIFFLYIFFGLHAYLAIVASYHALLSDGYDNRQKAFQLILAWLLPILGSLLVLLVALSDREHVRTITDNSKLPTPLFRLLTLSAFSGSVGLTGYDDGSTGTGWDGYDGASDGGCGDGDGGGGCDG